MKRLCSQIVAPTWIIVFHARGAQQKQRLVVITPNMYHSLMSSISHCTPSCSPILGGRNRVCTFAGLARRGENRPRPVLYVAQSHPCHNLDSGVICFRGTSSGLTAWVRSCLFAYINRGTPASASSCRRLASSSRDSSRRSISEASIT